MEIRKANKEDAAKIFAFVKEAVKKMDEDGIPQWDEIYPTQDDFTMDASKDQLYIAEIHGKPAACFTLNKDYECGNEIVHQKQFLVQDPDGYLLRFVD